ncbi:TetR family transcriptional regulator [Acrocarpospora pleiomorpha]|uniref:TetR family transcriptional regulator n=1 Tax=Acrocarpospora pleiomorpha TaxID=90975 RepID=A0A5M3XFD1_9ACTN|nr:TetR/AcrR family transcriptional regulator [Acrocarpospora pleiomorpha]GES19356.1 TetR family transcriptional regulator [Acrocarpospora pleiomorpha]
MTSDISRRRKIAAREQSAVYVERRQALMKAAAETFREQGLDGASLNDIASRAKLDRASLYYYVSSKEELYRALVEEIVQKNVEQVEIVRSGAGTGADKLREMIRLLMKSYAENYPHLYIFVAEDFGRRGPGRRQGRSSAKVAESQDWRAELSKLGDLYHTAVRDIVTEGFGDGSLSSPLSPGLVAHGVIGMVSWSHRWFDPDGRTTAKEIAEGFVHMVLDGLSPQP